MRGRRSDATSITWRLEAAPGPVPRVAVATAIERALAAWQATGVVGFADAKDEASADLVFGWRSGVHDACVPFLPGEGDLAHTGPMEEATFIHFNAAAEWASGRKEGASLFATAVHEVGHVLGLAHSPDPSAALYGQYDPGLDGPRDQDRLGIHSLYGGGQAGPGDLVFVRFDTQGAGRRIGTPLRGVLADAAFTFEVLDTDGDRAGEVLVWTAHGEGQGALLIHHFAPGPVIRLTVGPLEGISDARRELRFGHTADGEALMLHIAADRRYSAALFDTDGLPGTPWPPDTPLEIEGGFCDLDADGRIDPESAAGTPEEDGWREAFSGDQDGDGAAERLIHLEVPGEAGRWRWVGPAGPDGRPAFSGPEWRATSVRLGDLDRDGRLEAAVRGGPF